jgi:predicted outer membrane repeat protein
MSRFELCNITMVQLSGVNFTGCSGNRFKLVHRLLIEFASFRGKGNSSTAVRLIRSNAIIEKSEFVLYVGSTKWDNRKPSSTGGAIVMMASVVTIKDCTFERNSAEVGGAIYGELSYIEIINNSFTNNHAGGNSACFGGALYTQRGCSVKIYNSTFNNNSAYCDEELDSAGGSIAVEGGAAEIHIVGTEFYHNNAVHGGAIAMVEAPIMIRRDFRRYINDANIVTIKDSVFNWNTADKYGGVLRIEKATMSIHNSIFRHNNADSDEGGVLYMLETTTDVRMSLFKNNEAGKNGGVISAERCTMLNINGSYFISNKANLSGGVLNAVQTFTSISNTLFVKNKAVHSRGGAILLYLCTLNISRCNFRINIGVLGGAVALERIETVTITLTVFSKNFADLSGGAISIYDSLLTRTVSIRKSKFTKNIANIGGAIYARGSFILVSDSNFYENMAEGGIFQIFESITLFSHTISFINNMGSLFLFSSDFTVTKGTNLSFSNNSFPLSIPKGASSIQQGGAITAFQSNITLHGNCTLAHNYAKNGGAMHISQSKVFAYSSILILTNNSAMHRGGGIYLYQSEWNCKEHSTLKLIRNSAKMKGGGIHATSSLIFMDHVYNEGNVMSVQFVENIAEQGGGLYLEVNAKFHVLKRLLKFKPYDEGYTSLVLFYENTANYGEQYTLLMILTQLCVQAFLLKNTQHLQNVPYKR